MQRLLYYNFLKCFWNEAFDWETNNMVNFDWYHPHHAWQQTEEEVGRWLGDLGVASSRSIRPTPTASRRSCERPRCPRRGASRPW